MKTMKNEMIISFVLDESSSMGWVLDQTINGFNEYVGGIKHDEALRGAKFTLTKFSSDRAGWNSEFTDTRNVRVVHDGILLKNVSKLSQGKGKKQYHPYGNTPLYDAIGETIQRIETTIERYRAEDRNAPNVLMIVQTDGEENSSREYNSTRIKEMIQAREKRGWRFVFLGADQDAWANSEHMGFRMDSVMRYDSGQTRKAFQGLASTTSTYAMAAASAPTPDSLNNVAFFANDTAESTTSNSTTPEPPKRKPRVRKQK